MAARRKVTGPLRGGTKEKPEELASEVTASKRILVACDGSALNNPHGAGGWCWFISEKLWAAGAAPKASNNMMELTAVDQFLRDGVPLFDENKYSIRILLDSQYVYNTVTKWATWWMKNGWRLKDGSPVKNSETIASIMAYLMVYPHVSFNWVRAHNGHPLNEAADVRARDAAFSQSRHIPVNVGPGGIMLTGKNNTHPKTRTAYSKGTETSRYRDAEEEIIAWPGLLTTEHEIAEAQQTKNITQVRVDIYPPVGTGGENSALWKWEQSETEKTVSALVPESGLTGTSRNVFPGTEKEALLFATIHYLRNSVPSDNVDSTRKVGAVVCLSVPKRLIGVFSPLGVGGRSREEKILAKELVSALEDFSERNNVWFLTMHKG